MGFVGKSSCFSFTWSSIRKNAPPVSGVYGLSNARKWILIGEADDVQAALFSRLAEVEVQAAAPTGFTFELCQPAARLQRAANIRLNLAPTTVQPGKA